MRLQISRKQLQLLMCALFLCLFSCLATVKAQTAQPVTPFLDELIVNPTTGRATAYFGYHNPNAGTRTIPIGGGNFIFPSPQDRGQPTQLNPGVNHYAFAVVFDYHLDPVISWVLNTLVAQADSSTALAQPQNSIFTYQGRLTDGATAASGNYQMEFALFDATTGGTQIGSKITNPNVSVSNGLFTVQLNFGSSPFTGADRFLEIAVKRPADADYTTLAPRQQLTAAPFAIHTINATSADSLSNACVGCVNSAQIGSVDGAKVSGNVANANNATVAVTAGNVTGVVGVANGGTGSTAQNFVDLSTNQSNIGGNKSFTGILSGTFSGDGSGLTNVAGKFPWQVVAGTSQQAQANTGYLLTNANQVTVTLPATPDVGDVVRVSGAGAGGWRISQNAGQSILSADLNLIGASWTPRAISLGSRTWVDVAASADGTKLVAVVNGGLIYTSTDSGENWTERASSLGNKFWGAVASSADGTKLVAVMYGGPIYTSTDSGQSWSPRDSFRNWVDVASSANGTKLIAVVDGGLIYTSSNSGQTWTGHAGTTQPWGSVASSADGSKLFAAPLGGKMYASIDSGTTWTQLPAYHYWLSLASSSDGTKLVASDYNSETILTSTDAGMTWTMRMSGKEWRGLASSADGSCLIAVARGGQIYISSDAGVTWTARDSTRNWFAVASSADGRKHVAVVRGGQIYTSKPGTTPGPAGYLVGGQFAAIELQYLGGGQFLPLSYAGTILGN